MGGERRHSGGARKEEGAKEDETGNKNEENMEEEEAQEEEREDEQEERRWGGGKGRRLQRSSQVLWFALQVTDAIISKLRVEENRSHHTLAHEAWRQCSRTCKSSRRKPRR